MADINVSVTVPAVITATATDPNHITVAVTNPAPITVSASVGNSGDMMKSVYDTDNDGVVDNAEALGGVAASSYIQTGNASWVDLTDGGQTTLHSHSAGAGTVTSIATTAPITGGTITDSGTIGISAATTSAAGSMSAGDKTKLDGLVTNATHTGDVTGSGALTIANKVTMTGTAPVSVSGTPTVIAGSAVAISMAPASNGVNGYMTGTYATKLDGIASGAQVNNISDVNATDLTDGGSTNLHSHANDHARQHSITSTSDHTSTATSGQMLKADANGLPVNATNTDAQVSAAVTASHAAVTVADTASIDMSLTGQQISAAAIFGTTATTIAQGNHTHTGVYEPADATIVKTGNANWIDLTDGGATTLHSHALASGVNWGNTLIAKLAGDASTAADVNPISLSGLSFSFAANSTYTLQLFGAVSAAAATTGNGFQVDVSAAVTSVWHEHFHQLAATGTLSGGNSIADDASAGVSSGIPGTGTYPVSGFGVLITGANTGTAQLRFQSETTAVATCRAGTTWIVTKVA